MAKIRVYELARKLNMTNKALLEKISEMNIAVSSHMSVLENDAVAVIKKEIHGNRKENSETRGKAPVIRRRKKRFSEKKAPPGDDDKSPVKTVAAPSDDEDVPAEAHVTNGVKTPETAIGAANDAGPVLKDNDLEPPPFSTDQKLPEPGKKRPAADGRRKDRTGEKKDKTAPASKKESDPSETGKKPADRAKRKRKRKRKKDMPAKIIQLPPQTEEEPDIQETPDVQDMPLIQETPVELEESFVEGEPVVVQAEEETEADTPKDLSAKEKKRKKKEKEKEKEKEELEDRRNKKKISFKRKEVVEGADLYDKSARGKKSRKGPKVKEIKAQKTQITTPKAIKRRIKIDETIVLSDLAKRMGIKANEMIMKLMGLGVMATVNQTIDYETAVLVASEFGYELEKATFEEDTVLYIEKDDDVTKMTGRPPVVTIMGHVDHGKTSLLDVIRKTRITEFEAGGITQHIGAYSVTTEKGQITFLDTPGHEAFTAMRARGAIVTDIVVLVVAADDGVMPQTIEAINHSRAANVPIIVAINKIDKPGANPDRVIRQLADLGLISEEWGGDTIFVRVSAKQNLNIDGLLDMILLQSEVLELKANPEKRAKGYVVESKLDSGRGPAATILIQEGTLRAGEHIVCGVHYGKVRAMLNDKGIQVESAGPAEPVEVLGLSGVPNAGDEMFVLDDDKSARQVSEHRLQKLRSKELAQTSRISLEKLFERMKQGEVKDLNIIIKADVNGSIEALSDSLTKLSNEEVTIRVIHSGAGTVTESDISLAAVSNAIVIGFNVRPSAKVQALAAEESVDMRFYDIIYNVIKDVKDAILGMMESTYEERVLGQAEVRQVFFVPKIGAVAGSYITSGSIQRGNMMRLVRDGVVIYTGKIGSLRRFKDDVKEVLTGYECGIGVEGYNDIKPDDIIECYELKEIKPELRD